MSVYNFSTWDRNCDVEQLSPLDASVSGSVPSWLTGSVITNGPGKMKYGEHEFNHAFDGSAILQKYSFTETGVTYMSKFLKSYAYTANTEHQKIVVSELGTTGSSIAKGGISKVTEKFQFDKMISDNAPVALVEIGGNTYATTESPFLHRVDLDTLETLEKIDLHKRLDVSTQCHPVLLDDGSSVNVFSVVGPMGPKYELIKYPPTTPAGKASVFAEKPIKIATCDARWKLNPCHMHSFGVTHKHAILPEQPLTVDVAQMVTNTFKDKPLIDGMEWKKDKQTKFRVINLEKGKEISQKFKSEPFFYVHMINCFEKDDHIVLDLVCFDTPAVIFMVKIANIRAKAETLALEAELGYVRRYVFPLKADEKSPPTQNLITLEGSKATAYRQKDGSILVEPECVCIPAYENPTINQKYTGKPYKYFYGISADLSSTSNAIGKVNMLTGEVKFWNNDADVYPTSQVFVPKPNAESEDDGVLLVHCLKLAKKSTALAVLDGKTMEQLAMADFELTTDAPRTMHSIYHE